jgi:hypothetical protein
MSSPSKAKRVSCLSLEGKEMQHLKDSDTNNKLYRQLTDQGVDEAVIIKLMRQEIVRNAINNVHQNAQRTRDGASPKKFSSQTKSKVAGNMASRTNARKSNATMAENKAYHDMISTHVK